MNKIIITIDGWSSCGKSTLARQLAKELNYVYIDSGAMYRAITLYFIRHHIDWTIDKAVEEGQWRTVRVLSDIRGKAVLFKTISKNEDVSRTEFKRVPNNLTVAQAVGMLER